jgi:hypothetical protein
MDNKLRIHPNEVTLNRSREIFIYILMKKLNEVLPAYMENTVDRKISIKSEPISVFIECVTFSLKIKGWKL